MSDTFKDLLKESTNGNFTFETRDKFFSIEVNVCYSSQEITVFYYRGKSLEPTKKEKYHSLHGMFGYKDVETKFDEILNNLKLIQLKPFETYFLQDNF